MNDDIRIKKEASDLISIIVPVYNREQYLDRTVRSAIFQTYKNIEIILVDDGSTDGSGAICDKYAAEDQRIRVIHQNNRGPSAARNAGIEIAEGEYFAFLDSDDEMLPAMIETLYELAKRTDTKIACCSFYEEEEQNAECCKDFKHTDGYKELSDDEFVTYEGKAKYGFLYDLWKPSTVQWNKLFHRSIFGELRYPAGRYHEDEFVILQELELADVVAFTNKRLYIYYRTNDSITRTISFKRYTDAIEAILWQLKVIKEMGDFNLLTRAFDRYLVVRSLNMDSLISMNEARFRSLQKEIDKAEKRITGRWHFALSIKFFRRLRGFKA